MQQDRTQPMTIENDEIDLFELWNNLIQQKFLISIVAGVSLIATALYVFTATPTFKSTVYFLPPSTEEIQEMNALNLLIKKEFYKEDEIYSNFFEKLNSRDLKKSIFSKYEIVKIYSDDFDTLKGKEKTAFFNKYFNEFSEDLKINYPKKNSTSKQVSLSLQLKLPAEKVAQILNEMVELAEKEVIDQYIRDISAKNIIYQENLNSEIVSLRNIYEFRRLDKIARLEEAIKIARTLEIAKPMVMGAKVQVQGLSNQGLPLYYLGYSMLEAELNALENRKDDDPFITGLRKLQQQFSELVNLKPNVSKFGVVTIDQEAAAASKPVKPKKLLSLVIAGIVGLLIGVFVALIRSKLEDRKDKSVVGLK